MSKSNRNVAASVRARLINQSKAAGTDYNHLPMALDADEEFYVKPEVGQFLASPADETPMEPCDVQPDEYDIAEAVAQAADDLGLHTPAAFGGIGIDQFHDGSPFSL